MPYISSFAYCDSNGELLQSITPDYIPGNYTFRSRFLIVGFKADKEYSLSLEFKAPDGKIIFRTDEQKLDYPGKDENDNNPSLEKEWGMKINFEYQNVPMERAGLYITTVYANDTRLGNFAIPVFEGSDESE